MTVNTKLPFLDLQSSPLGAKPKHGSSAAGTSDSVGFGQLYSEQLKKPAAQKPRRELEAPNAKVEKRETRSERPVEHKAPVRKEASERAPRANNKNSEPETNQVAAAASSQDASSRDSIPSATTNAASQGAKTETEVDAEEGQLLPLDTTALPLFAQINALVNPDQTNVLAESAEMTLNAAPMTQAEFLKLMQKGASAGGGLDFKPEEDLAGLDLEGLELDGSGLMKMDDFSKLAASKGLSLDAKFQLQSLTQALPNEEPRMSAPPPSTLLSTGSREPQPLISQYTTSVQVPFHDAKWGEQMINKVLWLTSQNLRSAEIHLNPADLGPVDFKIQVQQDQTTTIQVHAHNPSVREALEANANRLREALANNGLELTQFDVSAQAGQQQSRDQQAEGSGQRQNHGLPAGDAELDVQVQETQVELTGLINTYA